MNNSAKWTQSLRNSMINNQQLEFTNNYAISYVHKNEPYIQQLKHRSLGNQDSLVCYIDGRSRTYKELSDIVQILWHFPLSKERYIIRAKVNHQQNIGPHWSLVDKEERKQYHSLQPDRVLDVVGEHQKDDLDKFNTQDKDQVSENFRVIEFEAFEVEHIKEAMPQVIADSRIKFESIFKPYKTVSRYLHSKNADGEWEIKALTM